MVELPLPQEVLMEEPFPAMGCGKLGQEHDELVVAELSSSEVQSRAAPRAGQDAWPSTCEDTRIDDAGITLLSDKVPTDRLQSILAGVTRPSQIDRRQPA